MRRSIADNVESTANITGERTEALWAIFNAIERLVSDLDIKVLCKHGALQARLAADEMSYLSEQANKDFPDCKKEGA